MTRRLGKALRLHHSREDRHAHQVFHRAFVSFYETVLFVIDGLSRIEVHRMIVATRPLAITNDLFIRNFLFVDLVIGVLLLRLRQAYS